MLDSWGSNMTFGIADTYRIIGYTAARRMVISGVMRRIRDDIFHEGEREMMIEWIM